MIKLVECPRDAMQGIDEFIPTDVKADYINTLLKVGFDTLDFGSFVSPISIPQLKDTGEVLKKLDLKNSKTKLLAIIANLRGAEEALKYDDIKYLGFPHAISEKFLELNINSTYAKALKNIESISKLLKGKKELIVYISLAFGNPYREFWSTDKLIEEIQKLKDLGIKTIILADTLGDSKLENIKESFKKVKEHNDDIEFGFHLHTSGKELKEKLDAAYDNGCRRFDSALLGFGGCPMSGHEMVGNLNTEILINYLKNKNIPFALDEEILRESLIKANLIFNKKVY